MSSNLPSVLLAEAVGRKGHVAGIDLDSDLLAFASQSAGKAGYSDRIEFCVGDASRIPFEDDAFDWAWSADCLGYPVGDLTPSLHELARVVKPGGCIAILAWKRSTSTLWSATSRRRLVLVSGRVERGKKCRAQSSPVESPARFDDSFYPFCLMPCQVPSVTLG
ncbi:MAG: class I SAM-dependent methyltransferase [Chloroflexi bacterium]|nr:class I SAM-dependent methyltransferase [Chloroflexota bacterium]